MVVYKFITAVTFLTLCSAFAEDKSNDEKPNEAVQKEEQLKTNNRVASNASDDLNLSVYSSGIALVKDTRKIHLKKGVNIVDIRNVSPCLELSSVNLKKELSANKINILSYEFIKRSLSTSDILNSAVGKHVSFIDAANNKNSGILKRIFQDAESNSSFALIQSDNKVEFVPIKRCVAVHSTDVSPRINTLRTCIYSNDDSDESIELYYITTGINWKPEYSIEIQEELNSARMLINATLQNTIEWDIKGAYVTFDYSSPIIDKPYYQQNDDPIFYKYPEKLSLKQHSSAMVPINSTLDIELNHCYLVKVPDLKTENIKLRTYNLITLNDENISRYIKSGNNAFVYLTNEKNKTFLGQQSAKFLNGLNNNDLSFSIGLSKDISASIKYVDIRNITEKISEISVLITIKNNTDLKSSVYIASEMSENYKILKENEKRVNSGLLLWNLILEPKATKELYYKVRVTKK